MDDLALITDLPVAKPEDSRVKERGGGRILEGRERGQQKYSPLSPLYERNR